MASLAPIVGGIPQRLKWEIKDYAFNPYELTAEKLASPVDEGLTKPPLGKAGPAAADAPVKRRPGRQKRTSVLCQVDGCGEELVDAKKYYRRYRICQLHCNMPSMTVDGRRQRFCQQCGRFHDIGEFESAKRSCKRKLKRHNERRRTSIISTSKKAATWQSDSEADAADAYNEMAVKVEGTLKRRSRRSMAATLAPEPSPPSVSEPALKSLHSGDSAASQNTATASRAGAGYMGGDSPSICGGGAPSAGHPASVAAPASLAPTMQPMHSANMDSSPMQCSDDPDQQAPIKLDHVATLADALPPAPSSFSPHIFSPWHQASQQEASPTVTTAPGSPLPATALACAPTSTLTDGDLDSVLQQLLQDEELQGLQLDPLEMFMPQEHAEMAIKTEPHCISMERAASHAPTLDGGNTWATQQFVHADPQSGVPALADLPMELLDDIPLIPLPEEMGRSSGSADAASTAGSGRSGATAVRTPSVSGGSDLRSLPQLGAAVAVDPMEMWQHQQWGMQSLPAADAHAQAPMLVPQHTLPSRSVPDTQGMGHPMHSMPSGVSPSVLASVHSMLSVPGFMAGGNAAPLVGYSMHHSTETIACLSLKVFNCTPDQLLPAVRQELETLLSVGQTLLEGCVRPGCTQLTLNALMTNQRIDELKAGGFVGMVSQLLANTSNNEAMQQDMLVQFEGELAVVKRRKVVALITLKSSPALVPALAPLLPLAVHATAAAPASTPLLLRGRHMCADEDLILARQHGRNLTVEMHACGEVQSGEYAKVRVLGLLPGCADVEVQHGTFLSQPRALLALPSLAAVAEVRQLERFVTGIENLDAMLRDIGLVVQYLQRDALQAEGYACPHYTPALLASIANKARRLVAAAAARGWAATTHVGATLLRLCPSLPPVLFMLCALALSPILLLG